MCEIVPGNRDKSRFPERLENVSMITNKEPAIERLNRPGWESVYEHIKRIIAVSEFRTKLEPNVNRPVIPNFVLAGNPGVGKSTIARLIGEIFMDYGILASGHTVVATREDLLSHYVGGTPAATMACVDRAEEGVLFIDEAHALIPKRPDSFEIEALSTLCNAITDPNRHFCIILAGYEEEMQEVFDLDPRIRRRFGDNYIVIEDYKPELLEKILLEKIHEKGCTIAQELIEPKLFAGGEATPLSCYMNRLYQERDKKSFGNAGEIEAIAERACSKADNGIVTESCFYTASVDSHWFLPYFGPIERLLEAFTSEPLSDEEIAILHGDSVAASADDNSTWLNADEISVEKWARLLDSSIWLNADGELCSEEDIGKLPRDLQ